MWTRVLAVAPLVVALLVSCGADDDDAVGSSTSRATTAPSTSASTATTATSGTTGGPPAAPLQPVQSGLPFIEPPRQESTDGVLQFDLVASGRGIDVAGAIGAGTGVRRRARRTDARRQPRRHDRADPRQPAGRAHQPSLSRDARIADQQRRQHLLVDRSWRAVRVLAGDPRQPPERHVLVPLSRPRAFRGAGVRRACRA